MRAVGNRSTPLGRVGYTPSQEWAKRNAACNAGRRRLGKLSIYEYWQRTCNKGDLLWVAAQLKPSNPEDAEGYREARNRVGLWVKGAWRYPSRMRKALIAIMMSFDVQWPTEIL